MQITMAENRNCAKIDISYTSRISFTNLKKKQIKYTNTERHIIQVDRKEQKNNTILINPFQFQMQFDFLF